MNTFVSREREREGIKENEYPELVRAREILVADAVQRESGLPLKIGIILNDKSSSHLSFRTYLNFRLLPSNVRYYLSKIQIYHQNAGLR